MFRFDQCHKVGNGDAAEATDVDTIDGVEEDENKDNTSGLTKTVTELENDADAAGRMVLGMLSIGAALFIAASFNGQEVSFLMKTAAEVPIVISIWFFWTTSNRFKSQSSNQRPPRSFSISLRGVMACMQILGAVATGALIWQL